MKRVCTPVMFCTLLHLFKDFKECKKILLERGRLFLDKAATCRQKIARLAHPFIRDGAVSGWCG